MLPVPVRAQPLPSPSPVPSCPLGTVLAPSPGEGEGGEGVRRRHREHHLPHERHESSPQRAAGVSPRHRIPALCPHAAEESQPKSACLASRQHPAPSFLPSFPRRHFQQPPAPLEKMLLFRRLFFFFFFLWLIWASWLQKEKTGLISCLPKLHTALQAVCVGSDAVERGFAPRELLLAAAHTLRAGSTAPLSIIPSQQ